MTSRSAGNGLRSARSLVFLNKVASLGLFLVLMMAGWVGVSYLKTGVIEPWRGARSIKESPVVDRKETHRITESSAEASRPSPPTKLVFSCGEGEEYHTTAHLPPKCERVALSEEAALTRGLKPCDVCATR